MLSIVVILVFATILILTPQFYFNEQELGFRKNFTNSYVSIGKAEQGIELRQVGPDEIDDETFFTLGKAIEDELENALISLEKASSYNINQNKIKFLLPSKYKEYLDLKDKSLDGYYQISESFRERKRNEHMTTETLMLIVQIDQSIYDVQNYEQWLQTLESLPQHSEKIKANADTLLANNHINQEFHDYIIKTTEGHKHLSTIFINAMENDNWDELDFSGMDEFSTPETEVRRMFEESKLDWEKTNQEHFARVSENDQELLIASNHFNQYELALDPISRLLSMFTDQFPRIKTTENREPTIVPLDVPIDLLSYLVKN